MPIYRTDFAWLTLILDRLKDYRNSLPEGIERAAMAHEIIWLETRIRRARQTEKKHKHRDEILQENYDLKTSIKELKKTIKKLTEERHMYDYADLSNLRRQMQRLSKRYGKRVDKVFKLQRAMSTRHRQRKAVGDGKPPGTVAGSERSEQPQHEGVRGPVSGDAVSVHIDGSPIPPIPDKTEPPLG